MDTSEAVSEELETVDQKYLDNPKSIVKVIIWIVTSGNRFAGDKDISVDLKYGFCEHYNWY